MEQETFNEILTFKKEDEEKILKAAGCRDLIELMQCKNCKNYDYDTQRCLAGTKTINEAGYVVEGAKYKPTDYCAIWEEKIEKKEQLPLRKAFDMIKLCLKEYVDMKEENSTFVATWIIGSWFHKEFETYPFLFLNAMRGTAKSRTLKLIAALQNHGEYVNSLTEAVLFRQNNPLAIDEFEGVGGKDKTALRELLNSSYKKGTTVKRMKKKKGIEGEEQVVETFDLYRPISMANIWGMEEVLGDRCITIFLERSTSPQFTKLMEDYTNFPPIQEAKRLLNELSVVSCSVVTVNNLYMAWHNYIKTRYTPNYIVHITTTNNTKLHLFEKIDKAEIQGRNLELFFPLFLTADLIGQDVLEELIEISKTIIEERKVEEITESKDVLMFEFVGKQTQGEWHRIKELTTQFRIYIHDDEQDNPWLNTKWVGRALKRLQLVGKKRRVQDGIEVLLNVDKAKLKMEMFK